MINTTNDKDGLRYAFYQIGDNKFYALLPETEFIKHRKRQTKELLFNIWFAGLQIDVDFYSLIEKSWKQAPSEFINYLTDEHDLPNGIYYIANVGI